MRFTETAEDSEDPQHTPAERARAGSRSTWVSVGVNLGLAAGQIVTGLLAKSQGLVADGIHSLSDLIADFVVLFASHQSKKDDARGPRSGTRVLNLVGVNNGQFDDASR